MVRDASWLAEFEDIELRKGKSDYASPLRPFEAMRKEAMLLGVLPLEDPLEGVEVDIKAADTERCSRSPLAQSQHDPDTPDSRDPC